MPAWVTATEQRPRLRLFARSQGPFVLSVIAVFAVVLLAHPRDVIVSDFLVGITIVVVSTVLALAVPWERGHLNAIAIVAILDLIAVAFIESAVYDDLPSIFVLIAFPLLWLAYGFPGYIAVFAALGALFVGVFPFVRRGHWPSESAQWADRLVLPIVASLIVLVVFIAARELRRQRDKLARASENLEKAFAQAQENLLAAERSSAITRAVTEEVVGGIVFFDVNGQPMFSNGTARRLSALSGYDPVTRTAARVTSQDRKTPLAPEEQVVVRALRGERIENYLYWVGPPGDQRGIIANARPVHLPDGSPVGTVLVGSDVTDLVNAIRVRDEFLATVTHELLTPLTSILGYLEIIQDQVEIERTDITEPLRVVERNAHHLESLIGDLLAASAHEFTLRFRESDVAQVCRNCIESLEPRAAAAGVALELDAPAALLAVVDPRRIQQVVNNLVSNAIKFAAGGHVRLRLRAVDDGIQIDVSDDGRGISPGDQRHIFDRFFRSDRSRRDAIQGVGLGLSIVASIVEAHGGTVAVSSAVDAGATFTVRIPRRLRETPPERPEVAVERR